MIGFEDLVCGQTVTLGPTGASRDQVRSFATTFDPQAFHLSDDAAAETYFGRLSASGWHTASMMLALVTNSRDWPLACQGVREIRDLRWRRPVYPDDVLTASIAIDDTERLDDDRGAVTLAVALRNQNDDTVAEMRALLIVAARGAGSPRRDGPR